MPTQYLHRILIVTNNARRAALTTWWVNNIDPNGATTFDQGLSASGNLPATHWVACATLTNNQVALCLNRWYQIASLSPPQWGQLNRQQIRQRIQTDWNTLIATGIRMFHCDNDGAWDNFYDRLTQSGLQFIRTV